MNDQTDNTNKVSLNNDHWTLEIDQLGYMDYALHIRKLILQCETPMTFTISGRWGSGKTSMLRTLMASFCDGAIAGRDGREHELPDEIKSQFNDDDTVLIWPVWFNPWQYQHEEQPLIPLLHEIREQMRGLVKAKNSTKKVSAAAFDTAIHTISTLIDYSINLSLGRKLSNIAESSVKQYRGKINELSAKNYEKPLNTQHFHSIFKEAVSQVTEDKGKLVIFIDDLDRCMDVQIFKMLEQIKLYLSSKNCVFILGLDRAHVEKAIVNVTEYNMDEARQYVEKIFQAQFFLPEPSSEKMNIFIKEQINRLAIPDFHLDSLNAYLPKNPRLIKSILNGFVFHLEFLDKDKKEKNGAVLMYRKRTLNPIIYNLEVA